MSDEYPAVINYGQLGDTVRIWARRELPAQIVNTVVKMADDRVSGDFFGKLPLGEAETDPVPGPVGLYLAAALRALRLYEGDTEAMTEAEAQYQVELRAAKAWWANRFAEPGRAPRNDPFKDRRASNAA